MGKVLVFLAEGFEEIEALTPVDMLRRAGIEVLTVGVASKWITGSHQITVQADLVADENFMLPKETQALILPGGMPGTVHLRESKVVACCVQQAASEGLVLAAICAAPSVLQMHGLLEGRRYTAFPGVVDGAGDAFVEVDGNIITARGAGVSLAFSKAVIVALKGEAVASEVITKMQVETLKA